MNRKRKMEYRTRTTITINAELDILKEIKDLCEKERKSLSEKINELFIGELEKKVVGQNPLNISYDIQREKPSLGTLDAWISRTEAIRLIKKIDDADTCEHIGKNLIVAARFKRTGIIRDVKVI